MLLGDPTLFQRADQVEAGWRVVQPVLDGWAKKVRAIPNYEAGSVGPKDAARLLQRDGHEWRPLVGDL